MAPSRLLRFVFLCWVPAAMAQGEGEEIERSKALLHEVNDPLVWVGAYNDLAWEYYYVDFDSAMHYVSKAMALSAQLEDPYWKAVSMEMLAILKEMSGQVEDALNLYFEVIPLRESMGGNGLENTYNNLAVIFRNQENYEKSLEYFRRSYEIEVNNGYEAGIAASLINMALAEMRLNRLDSVPTYYRRAMRIAEATDDLTLLSTTYLNLAEYHDNTQEPDSAYHYYKLAHLITGQTMDNGARSVAAFGLAEISKDRGELGQALDYLAESEQLARKINSIEYIKRVHGSRAEVLGMMGLFQEAFMEQQKYAEAKDSLISLQIIGLTNELETRYQTERKERQIAELELSSAEQALRAEANRNQRNLLIFAAALLALFVGFMAYRYRNQRRVSAVLTEKNTTIARALRDREILLKEIHHRVKNNLQVVSSLLSIQGREIKDEKALEAVNESKNRVKSMALIHQYLYGDTDLKSIDMQQYVEQLSKSLFGAYRVDHDQVELRTEVEPILLDVDTAVPLGIIINELVTNALKYAFPEGRAGVLTVSLSEVGDQLVLRVTDNGVGLEAVDPSHLSFGTKLLNAFKSKLNATINTRSHNGVEVTYTIGTYRRSWAESTASLL